MLACFWHQPVKIKHSLHSPVVMFPLVADGGGGGGVSVSSAAAAVLPPPFLLFRCEDDDDAFLPTSGQIDTI